MSKEDSEKEKLIQDLLALGKECRARMKEPYLSTDIGELLYDKEFGLPINNDSK